MSVGFKQHLKQSQTLTLSPQMQQAIKLLAMPRMELEEFLQQELRDNPFLEEDPRSIEKKEKKEVSIDSVDLGLSQGGQVKVRSGSDEDDNFQAEIAVSNSVTLYEHLENQTYSLDLGADEQENILDIIQFINEEGFLEKELALIAEDCSLSLEQAEAAVKVIQSFDPPGVGAKDMQECLVLQSERLSKKPPHTVEMLKECWKEIQKQDAPNIAKKLRIAVEEARQTLDFIKEHLDPHPARDFGESNNAVITPDVMVFKQKDQWTVSLYDEGVPRVRVNLDYKKMFDQSKKSEDEKTKSEEVKDYIQNNMKNAQWLLHALEERGKTLLRVTQSIVQHQMEFFEKGTEYLKPLVLKTIADELGLHESTISRATQQKYAQTPRGLFELKYFFRSGLSSATGEEKSNEVIKSWIADYIAKENAQKPMSDQDISDFILKDKNMKIARRTVAKYREALGILPTSLRRRRG